VNREQARIVVLVIAAWVMGALMGSQVQFRAKGTAHPSDPVRFPAGLYQIEPSDPGDGGDKYWIEYETEWQARLLTR